MVERLPVQLRAALLVLLLFLSTAPWVRADPEPEHAAGDLQELLQALDEAAAKALPASRLRLLGRRSLAREPSCVGIQELEGTTLKIPGSPEGGIGMRTVSKIAEKSKATGLDTSAADLFEWYQVTFRDYGRVQAKANRAAMVGAETVARLAHDVRDALQTDDVPPSAMPDPHTVETTWIGFCLRGLMSAAADGDAARSRIWAAELVAAADHLVDLHRWTAFLLRNQADMLTFQALCEALYRPGSPAWRVEADGGRPAPKGLPAAGLVKPLAENLLEVERQAERLFQVPSSFLELSLSGEALVRLDGCEAVPAARWMPPDLRATFVRLRAQLSPRHQAEWDAAATSPYDQSYLANILFRLRAAGCTEAAMEVLRRFDARHPEPDRDALLDVLFYRSEPNMGMDWGERYNPEMMQVAGGLTGDRVEVLRQARAAVRKRFGTWQNYETSLRITEALDTGRMDCIMATGMAVALARNAGCGGFYSLRWSTGPKGHSVAGVGVPGTDPAEVLTADALDGPGAGLEPWPWAYLKGHVWPAGWPYQSLPVFCVELYGRGLDNYVWIEGYVVTGPRAGSLAQVSVPYLATHLKPRLARQGPPDKDAAQRAAATDTRTMSGPTATP